MFRVPCRPVTSLAPDVGGPPTDNEVLLELKQIEYLKKETVKALLAAPRASAAVRTSM